MNVITKVSAITMLGEGKAIFDEDATTVRVEDEAAGPFLVIEQEFEGKRQQIRLCFNEIQPLFEAMEELRKVWR